MDEGILYLVNIKKNGKDNAVGTCRADKVHAFVKDCVYLNPSFAMSFPNKFTIEVSPIVKMKGDGSPEFYYVGE